jgi:phage tail tube protein FII
MACVKEMGLGRLQRRGLLKETDDERQQRVDRRVNSLVTRNPKGTRKTTESLLLLTTHHSTYSKPHNLYVVHRLSTTSTDIIRTT